MIEEKSMTTRAVLIGIPAGLLITITVGGNILVLLSFIVEKSLRTPTNYLIASLALTDVLIGSVSMSFYSIVTILEHWPFGSFICDLWNSVDYTACLTSQYTVLFITLDRFCSVKFPTKYRLWRTKRIFISIVIFTWLVPAALFFTIIHGWTTFKNMPRNMTNRESCDPLFLQDKVFSLALTVAYYWTTLVVMISLYAGIYSVALKLQKKSVKRKMVTNAAVDKHRIPEKTSDGCTLRHEKKSSLIFDIGPESTYNNSSYSANSSISKPKKGFYHAYRDSRKNRFYGNKGKEKYARGASVIYGPVDDSTYQEKLKKDANSALLLNMKHISTQNESSTMSEEDSGNFYEENCNNLKNTNSILKGHISGAHMARIRHKRNQFFGRTKGSISSIEQNFDPLETKMEVISPYVESITSVNNGKKYISESGIQKIENLNAINQESSADEHEDADEISIVWEAPKKELQKENHVKIANPKKTWINHLLCGSDHCKIFYSKPKYQRGRSENRAYKALRTISLILGAFVICWTPYHVVVFYNSATGYKAPDTLNTLAYWLCYFNSPINPFCYALANAQFKKTFLRLLKGDFKRY